MINLVFRYLEATSEPDILKSALERATHERTRTEINSFQPACLEQAVIELWTNKERPFAVRTIEHTTLVAAAEITDASVYELALKKPTFHEAVTPIGARLKVNAAHDSILEETPFNLATAQCRSGQITAPYDESLQYGPRREHYPSEINQAIPSVAERSQTIAHDHIWFFDRLPP